MPRGLGVGVGPTMQGGQSLESQIRALFAAGEQGGWYDPSDMSTMYQDSTGNTPASLESPVGFLADKRLGTTGLSTIGWVQNGGDGVVTINGNQITITGATVTTRVDIAVAGWNTGDLGTISLTANVVSATAALVYLGAVPQTITTGTKTYSGSISGTLARMQIDTGTATFTVNSRSKVTGNHLIQATAASRPTLSARYNKLTKTEDFSDAVWSNGAGAVTVTTNVDGNYDKVIPTATLATHRVVYASGFITNSGAVIKVRAKAGGYTKIGFKESGTSGSYAAFDLSNGTLIENGGATATSIVLQSDGAYLITVTWASVASIGISFNVLPPSYTTGDVNGTWTADGVNGILLCYADARTTADAALAIPAYQRVDTATSYDTSGFPNYLSFDGVDDNIAIAAWSGGAIAQPTTGVAAFSIGAVPATNNYVYGSTPGRNDLFVESNGKIDTYAGSQLPSAAAITPLTPYVVQSLYNGASSQQRINKATIASGDAGAQTSSGLTVGALGGGSLYLLHRNYGLIFISRALTTAEKNSVDTYLGSKMGIAL